MRKTGNLQRFSLPRPMTGRDNADFSLSGLKTAVRLEAENIAPLSEKDIDDLCASFQRAIADVVFSRVRAGLGLFHRRSGKPTALVAAGGVAANEMIRQVLKMVAQEAMIPLVVPPQNLCTDNGAMIAWAGAERLELGLTDGLDVSPRARWPLEEVTHLATQRSLWPVVASAAYDGQRVSRRDNRTRRHCRSGRLGHGARECDFTGRDEPSRWLRATKSRAHAIAQTARKSAIAGISPSRKMSRSRPDTADISRG